MIGFAEVAALITVVGAATYGLGLLGVAWPIHKRWHNDAATTWYAISLIPRAVVAGQGMRIFVGFPTIMATLLLMWWLIVFPILRLLSVVASDLAAWVVGMFALLTLLAGGYWLLRSKYRRRIQWLLGPTPDHPRYGWLVWITVGLAVPTFFEVVCTSIAPAARRPGTKNVGTARPTVIHTSQPYLGWSGVGPSSH